MFLEDFYYWLDDFDVNFYYNRTTSTVFTNFTTSSTPKKTMILGIWVNLRVYFFLL